MRSTRASAISSSVPASNEPTGAASPFDRQHMTVVAGEAYSAAATPVATSALNKRAPSRCTGTPSVPSSCSAAKGHGTPPAGMCVFSTNTADTGGLMMIGLGNGQAYVVHVDQAVGVGHQVELRRTVQTGGAGLVDHHVLALAGDHSRAGAAEQSQRDLVRHRARRHEDRRLLTDSRREGLLEVANGRVLAVAVVAHDRVAHGPPHHRGWFGDGVGAQVDESLIGSRRLGGRHTRGGHDREGIGGA